MLARHPGHPDRQAGPRAAAAGLCGAFRRSELVALTVADLTDAEGGLRVLIRRSKTDQEGQGQEIAIPHGGRLRPVEAVQAWLAAAAITDGPVFRPVAKGGTVSAAALSDRSVAADREAVCRARPGSIPPSMPATACAPAS